MEVHQVLHPAHRNVPRRAACLWTSTPITTTTAAAAQLGHPLAAPRRPAPAPPSPAGTTLGPTHHSSRSPSAGPAWLASGRGRTWLQACETLSAAGKKDLAVPCSATPPAFLVAQAHRPSRAGEVCCFGVYGISFSNCTILGRKIIVALKYIQSFNNKI